MSLKLTQSDADLIRVFAEETRATKAALAREYDVHPDTIRNILNRKSFTGDPAVPRRNPNRKLSNEQVIQIRCLSKLGYKPDKIATKMEHVVSKSTIRQVVEGSSYKDVGLDGSEVDRGI